MTRRRSAADEAALLQVLGQSPIFRHGDLAALATLAAQATPFDYPVGSFLMRQGEPADHVVVLIGGRAEAQGTWRELEDRWGHLAG